MLVVVSPAKKLNMDAVDGAAASLQVSAPVFADRATELAKVAGALSPDELQKLMSISANLAALNAERFAGFGGQATKPAVLAFAGDTYQGLDAQSLDAHELAWAQDHLRILSGLYGVLRPMDAIEPYRLEMGSKLATKKGKSLYEYWGRDLAAALNQQAGEVGAEGLVNCASQEYFGAVDQAELTMPVITPIFKEIKDGNAKIVSFFAKKARGAMARFIIQENITKMDDLKSFSSGGYRFVAEQSDANNMMFMRDYPSN